MDSDDMPTKITAKEERTTDPALYLILVILFIISIIFIGVGLLRPRNNVDVVNQTPQNENLKQEDEEISVADYFEGDFDNNNLFEEDEFLRDDPFAQICAETSGDGRPAIVSNTVCFR